MKYPPCSTGYWPLVLLCIGVQAGAATERLARCSWDSPGHDPFMGSVVAAVDRYTDIPADVRGRLQHRMAQRRYDDLVSIRRDSIEGEHHYDTEIRDMHFGASTICMETTRARWTAQMHERGLVYCESGHCILVPTVCRNVSRITRRSAPETPPPLLFDPPGAGTPQWPPMSSGTFTDIATSPAQPPLGAPPDPPTGFPLGGSSGPFGGLAFTPPSATPPTGDMPLWESPLPVGTVPYEGAPAPIAAVPEASTTSLLLVGLGWLALRWRRAVTKEKAR